MRYRISRQANQDLEDIWLYTYRKWSRKQADRYFNLIMDEIVYLAANPQSGTNYDHVREGYYRSRIKSQVIFYKINHQQDAVEIIRILHQPMDLPSRLKD